MDEIPIYSIYTNSTSFYIGLVKTVFGWEEVSVLNLYHLRYFVTLAHWEHYTKAAEELSITQPSLSHAISSLEDEIGVPLFEKEGRNIVLTKYGRLFLSDVEKSLQILDAGVSNLDLTSRGGGKIDVAYLQEVSLHLVPALCRSFLDSLQKDNVCFHFHTLPDTDSILEGLKEKKYDIAFCKKSEKDVDIEFSPVFHQELVLIVPPSHPLASFYEIDLKTTLGYPQIGFSRDNPLRGDINRLFAGIGKRPVFLYELMDERAIAGLVVEGFGIAILPENYFLNQLNLRKIPIRNPGWEQRYYMAVRRDKYLSPAVLKFKNFVNQRKRKL